MLVQDLLKYQDDIHSMNVLKGYWLDGVNRGEKAMLIVTELSEAVEAHRINNRTRKYDIECLDCFSYSADPNGWSYAFVEHVKDSVEDEMADVVIRILDYCKGLGLMIYEREYRKESTGNFANDVLRLTHYCLCAYHNESGKDWGYMLAAIIKFCEWYEIDLNRHITWKLMCLSALPKSEKRY